MNRFRFISLGIILWLGVVLIVRAQQQQRLQEVDYARWHHLTPMMISDNGDWSVFRLSYPSGGDTLCVGSTAATSQVFRFANGANGQFSPAAGWFACQEDTRVMALLQLKTGAVKRFMGVDKFMFTPAGKLLMQQGDTLTLLTPGVENAMRTIYGVKAYTMNAKNDKLLLTEVAPTGETSLQILSCDGLNLLRKIHSAKHGDYKDVRWHRQADALTFLHGDSLYVSRNLLETSAVAIPHGFQTDSYRPVTLSDDLDRVFVSLAPTIKQPLKSDSMAQVWHVDDRWIYPRAVGVQDWANMAKLFMWEPAAQSSIRQVSDDSLPHFLLSGKQDFLLSYNKMGRPKHYRQLDDLDIYLTNLKTGQRILLIEQLENGVDLNVQVSPGGRYVAYFKDHHWWAYDLHNSQHVQMTKRITVPLEYIFGASNSDASIYPQGSAGWTVDDEGYLIYDQYDCWLVSPTGDAPKRLTDGRESQKRFRYYSKAYGEQTLGNRDFGGQPIELKQAIFEVHGPDRSSGFYGFNARLQPRPLVHMHKKVSHLMRASANDAYTYTTETFDQSPALQYVKSATTQPRLVYQSNPQQANYQWGHSELIYYHNSKAEVLKGALLYPADYQPGKQYPMIVDIYQNKSGCVHEYVLPAVAEGAGINYSVYTSKGYFVLCPDINYTIADAGMSAVDCVEAAVNAVIAMGVVDPKRIGLTGHSFGGYETTFIITQSNLFACAMAGAPITDMVKGYLTLHEYANKEEFWRYEHQQNRYGYPFFTNPAAYYRNSPVYQAEKIQTPLFFWTGKEDRQVHWYQGVELYLALRRLEKEAVFCVYPGEHHVLMDPAKQLDMTQRTMAWFDHYLKGKPAASWMTEPRNR